MATLMDANQPLRRGRAARCVQTLALVCAILAAAFLTAQPVRAEPPGQSFEQGRFLYSVDFAVGIAPGVDFPFIKGEAAHEFRELHRCFGGPDCSFPVGGAPAAYPAQGQHLPLEVLGFPFPVKFYSNEPLGYFYLVGEAGHPEGEGSRVLFVFYSDSQGILHLLVSAFITAANPKFPESVIKQFAHDTWFLFSLRLGRNLLAHTCGSFNCPPISPPPPPRPPQPTFDLRTDCGHIFQGQAGRCVSELQRLLNGHGASLTIDGIFGPATDAAVRNFQSRHGLSVDGIVGPATKAALYGNPSGGLDLRRDCGPLAQGSTGRCVTQLQKLLNARGAGLTVDGIFGPATDAAVRSFQSRSGLSVDGIVGPRTKAALYGSTEAGLDLRSECGQLQRGSTGECVRMLQRLLNSAGASLAVDGIFGPATESAVRSYQADTGLVVDGIVGPATKAALYGGGGGPRGVDLRTDCGLLRSGSSGGCVRELQQLLNSHGASLAVDGIFGPATDAAVRRFQSRHGLLVDGLVGPETKGALYGSGSSSWWGGTDLGTDCGILQQGARGGCVSELQNLLNGHGASLAVDGIFGPATYAAVRSFQSRNGLTVDGIVGPQTKALLYVGILPVGQGAIDYARVVAAARVAVTRQIPYSWGGGHAATPGPSGGTCVGYTGSIQPCPARDTIGLDCSGLVRWAYWVGAGIDFGNGGNTDAQFRSPRAVRISESQKRPGDLEFFGTPNDVHHVVMYSGVKNGVAMMIETNRTGTNAHESPLRTGGLWVHIV